MYNLIKKNQLHIFELAHAEEIIQIVSLSKLKHKYFATRCIEGHVNIWSATNHPDLLFNLWQVDANEKELEHLQPKPEPEPVVEIVKKKKEKENSDDESEEEEEEEEEVDEEEEKRKKKK